MNGLVTRGSAHLNNFTSEPYSFSRISTVFAPASTAFSTSSLTAVASVSTTCSTIINKTVQLKWLNQGTKKIKTIVTPAFTLEIKDLKILPDQNKYDGLTFCQ